MKKILLTGSTGLFGAAFNKFSENKFVIFNHIHFQQDPSLKNKCYFDLNKSYEIDHFVKKKNIDIIIHAAATTNVDYCEINKKKAYETNVKTTFILSKVAKKYKIKLIFISSDQLFDGKKHTYFETTKYSPLNYYGKTKVICECNIIEDYNNYLILRTNFFGAGRNSRKSLSDFIIDNISQKKKITLFDDIVFNPVYLRSLVFILCKLIIKNETGIFNISSDSPITKYQFGILLAKKFKLGRKYIQKGSVNQHKYKAQRPKNMFLSNKKIKKNLQIKKILISSEINSLYKDIG